MERSLLFCALFRILVSAWLIVGATGASVMEHN